MVDPATELALSDSDRVSDSVNQTVSVCVCVSATVGVALAAAAGACTSARIVPENLTCHSLCAVVSYS